MLYIFWLLHQTTTSVWQTIFLTRCISFDSYIKPQHPDAAIKHPFVVYLLTPTSNHNPSRNLSLRPVVVYLLTPTSNHNMVVKGAIGNEVVYLLTPTSNHNFSLLVFTANMLYIFWLLHQTTTVPACTKIYVKLYIFWLLHQTTTILFKYLSIRCCISFDSYIKPQLWRLVTQIPSSCISFDSYIKPQRWMLNLLLLIVVYLLTPTSNHNLLWVFIVVLQLYIFWLLHQTTTLWQFGYIDSKLYIFWLLHQTTTTLSCGNISIRCISFDSYIKPQPRRHV